MQQTQRSGRVASQLADRIAAGDGVRGSLCLRRPVLILQGARNSFGRRGEVESRDLPVQVQLRWTPSGDHSFRPTRSSGLSEAENWAKAPSRSANVRQARKPWAVWHWPRGA